MPARRRFAGSFAAPRGPAARGPAATLAVTLLVAAIVASAAFAPAAFAATLIRNVRVIDGTGSPARAADVRIEGGRIAAVGTLPPTPADVVVDGGGLVLAPGFIDTHSHADGELFEHRDALAAVSQGITTVVVGQDGDAPMPLADFFARVAREPATVNVASYAGHGTIREKVMGEDFRRVATKGEVKAMKKLLDVEMQSGALGLASGLEYDPGIYASRDEMIDLARVAAKRHGRYISHIRSEDRDFWEAIEEIINIGREAKLPVQVSHMKLAMTSWWGQTDRLLNRLDQARADGVTISADIYPYLYWHSTLTVLFPKRDFEDLAEARLVVQQIVPPDGLLLTQYDPEPAWAGRTLASIAAERNEEPAVTLIELLRRAEARRKEKGDAGEAIIGTSMTEADFEKLFAWHESNVCTDGSLDGSHPRGFGTYPRVLGRYVRERKVMTLEGAVRRMSGLAAAHMGFTDRGLIKPGQAADLVLFDPATVIDRATIEAPHAVSEGIAKVWVAGELVYAGGAVTDKRPGVAIRRAGK
ncbi:MAG TPA: D-aminoacylase [Candidatus Polarisedimenticolia bacterium]|nr:D-aminoacylase [Candidatus Polarisedimenticolia bacterium]